MHFLLYIELFRRIEKVLQIGALVREGRVVELFLIMKGGRDRLHLSLEVHGWVLLVGIGEILEGVRDWCQDVRHYLGLLLDSDACWRVLFSSLNYEFA